jgi:hypothetical protein
LGTFSTIDFPGTIRFTEAFGINSEGDIVGDYVDTNFVQHGFELRNGTFSTIDLPGAKQVSGINAARRNCGVDREHPWISNSAYTVTSRPLPPLSRVIDFRGRPSMAQV